MIRKLVPLLAAFALLSAPPALAGKNKITHSAKVEPALVGSPVQAGIGRVTGMQAVGGVFYLAGQDGLAAVTSDGTVKWKLELPPAITRNVQVVGDKVAFTSYAVSGVDPSAGFAKLVMGGLGDEPLYSGATVGVASTAGELLWSVDAAEQAALAPPAISPTSVGVLSGGQFTAYGLADGAVVGQSAITLMGADMKGVRGMIAQATRVQPVVIGDAFYTSFFGILLKYDFQGKELDRKAGAGLTMHVSVTCGPVAVGEKIVFGSTGDTNVANAFFAYDDRLKVEWKEWSPDDDSGCGSLVANSTHVIAASNFMVFAFDPKKGKVAWESVNKKGGLYPSPNRGVRYTNGWFGVRKSYGDLMVADDKRVYITSKLEGDVVTVLDAADGKYVHTLTVGGTIVSMTLLGDVLAIATDEDVRFVKVGG